jgi:hypothetical protein
MTAPEREAVRTILLAVQTGQWGLKGVCPRCSCSQMRGHKCSCPVKRATKLLNRTLGKPEPGLEDEDLIVHAAMGKLAKRGAIPDVDLLAIVWEAVDAAMHLGARTS